MKQFTYYLKAISLSLTAPALLMLASSCSKGNVEDEVVRTRYYHPYGPELSPDEWKEQGMSGEVSEYRKNGITVRKSYRNNVLHGESSWSYPNSPIVYRYEDFDHGALTCRGENYENGSPKMQENIRRNGDSTIHTWREDGTPRSIEEWVSGALKSARYFNNDGHVEAEVRAGNGTRIERGANDVLIAKEQYLNGQLSIKELFYHNGVQQSSTTIKNGLKHGLSHSFSEIGKPVSIERWNEDRLDGEQIYFDRGLESSRIPYKNGVKDGVEIRLSPGSQQIVAKISWKNGKRHGQSIFIFPDREISEWYWKDEKVSYEQFALRQKQANSGPIEENNA